MPDVCPRFVPPGMRSGKSPKSCRKVTWILFPDTIQTLPTPPVQDTATLGCGYISTQRTAHGVWYALTSEQISVLVQPLDFRNIPGSSIRAKALAERHLSLPEQSFGHANLLQADPSNMVLHEHCPVFLSHLPRLEHSAKLCAESLAVAESLHVGPSGQFRSEQSGAASNPVKHSQTPMLCICPFRSMSWDKVYNQKTRTDRRRK